MKIKTFLSLKSVLLCSLFLLMHSFLFSQITPAIEDAPAVISSEKSKPLYKKAMLKPILFRWKPEVAGEKATYRLTVWQLKQGQTGAQAKQNNKPILTKEVRNVSEVTVANLPANPCKPPYLCDFVWEVETLDNNTRAIIRPNAAKQLFTFALLDDNINIKIDSLDVGCCKNGKQSIFIRVVNMHTSKIAQVTAIRYRVNGTGLLTTLNPVPLGLPFSIPANSSKVFTTSIDSCINTMTSIKLIVEANWPVDPDNINYETASDTLRCACDACDSTHFVFRTPLPTSINYNADNTLSFIQPMTVVVPTKPIKRIEADLVYFEMTPENDFCIPCNKESATYGHFANGSNSQEWDRISRTMGVIITTPQLTPCCSAVFRWCIRYKVVFEDCTTCNKLVCYTKQKQGCTTNPNPNPSTSVNPNPFNKSK